jgi:hypothetical protein
MTSSMAGHIAAVIGGAAAVLLVELRRRAGTAGIAPGHPLA